VEGIVEQRPELVGSDYGVVICSARPELEEEDVRRRQSAAKVRWWVEEGAPRRRARKPLRRRSGHGVCVSELGIDSIRG